MHLRGLIQSASLREHPPESDRVEMVLKIQGVGPSQPRTIVIPFEHLVQDQSLEPETIVRRGFEADVEQDDEQRWVVSRIAFASRVLRPPE